MDLITGATGIVGAHLLLRRLEQGAAVRALRRSDSDLRVVERIFRHYRSDAAELFSRIAWVEGDVLDITALKEAMRGVRHVYHPAALVSFDPRDDRRLMRVNRTGTANVVNAALLSGVERLCHVSSTAAIGRGADGEIRHEELPWDADLRHSPYALSKYAAELEVYRGMAEGLDAVLVNPCIVIGPGAPGRSSMTLVERLARGISHYPPGSNAVVDARDVAEAMERLMAGPGGGERYLLVGANVSYKELFASITRAFGHRPPVKRLRPWMLHLAWRVERSRTLFGGKPLVTRHTAASALEQRAYTAAKAERELGYRFRGLEEMVDNVARYVKGAHAH